jgi:hypothetical protein
MSPNAEGEGGGVSGSQPMSTAVHRKPKKFGDQTPYLTYEHSPCAGASKNVTRGRIIEQNPDKSLQSFPPCYSQSPLQLCLEISLYFFKLAQPLTFSTVHLHCTVLYCTL